MRATILSALLLIPALATVPACRPAGARCSVCDRHECKNLALAIVWKDGERQETCCPRCGARLIATKGTPASVTVRDFDSALPVPAERAVFVEGSDVHPCRGIRTEALRDDNGCCLTPEYDRCEPSVVAFGGEAGARRFMDLHGGVVVSWSSLASPRASR